MKKIISYLIVFGVLLFWGDAFANPANSPFVSIVKMYPRPLKPAVIGPVVVYPVDPVPVPPAPPAPAVPLDFCSDGPDRDGDCVADDDDNCPFKANNDQKDSNFNGMGDVCEGDYDSDTVPDASDNCWDVPNADQFDLDGDDAGDVCDIDRDGDGYTNDFEAGIGTSPNNFDTDGDNVTDYYDCDKLNPNKGIAEDCSVRVVYDVPPPPPDFDLDPNGDADGDGILNGSDNCPEVYNPGQQDLDNDGRGDACDNETINKAEIPVAQGGGGFTSGCSFVPQAASTGIGTFLFLLGLPFLGFLKGLRRKH